MPEHDLVVIGASAGAVPALTSLVSTLPKDLPAPVLLTVHVPPFQNTRLPEILSRAGSLPAKIASNGESMRNGTIYIAPPDHHLLVHDGRLVVVHGPRENGFRPAVDPMFRTAAETRGDRTIGVILSGALDDGTFGLLLIKEAGGVALVQDPDEAEIPGMPASAIRAVRVDGILTAAEIGRAIGRLVKPTSPKGTPMERHHPAHRAKPRGQPLPNLPELTSVPIEQMPGPVTALTCPDCGGALWDEGRGEVKRFRCHVGHTFTPDGLAQGQEESLEHALYSAVRGLEEIVYLNKKRAAAARRAGDRELEQQFLHDAQLADRHAQTIKSIATQPRRPLPDAATIHTAPHPKDSSTRRSRRRPLKGPNQKK